jgi:hypothetical protein
LPLLNQYPFAVPGMVDLFQKALLLVPEKIAKTENLSFFLIQSGTEDQASC